MNTFEVSSLIDGNGRRKFKAVLYRIFPDDTIDTENGIGTRYNENGITWKEEYCEAALPSIQGMSLRCEFLNDERTILAGHGLTDIEDGLPIFEDACVIGIFENGYIDNIVDDDGSTIRACIGEGTIDASCYHNLCEQLDLDIAAGHYPSGSVEIMHAEGYPEIVYEYGYKPQGRIPKVFAHSGYAILGWETRPADPKAKVLELNQEEEKQMNDQEIKALASQIVDQISNHTAEINQCKEDCDKKISELNISLEDATAKMNEAETKSASLEVELNEAKTELEQKAEEIKSLNDKITELNQALDEAKAKERISEMNSAISEFTDAEKEYAKEEIEAFEAAPLTAEINSVVSKIWEGIGKAAKEEKHLAEQNSAKDNASADDIFGDVSAPNNAEDIDIFN